MKIKSILLALVMAVIAAGTVATANAGRYYDNGYYRGERAGLFGGGGFLGTGVGRSRYYDDGYYAPRRGIVGGAVATTGNVIEDVTGLPTGDDYSYRGYRGYRGYRRGW